jgi:hypothetical protein
MIHLYLEKMGWESPGSEDTHNAAFRRFAVQVCKYHGFDPKAFYRCPGRSSFWSG